jgi:membrane-associated phospholipid phosphatase
LAMLCIAALVNRWIKLSLHVASLAFAGVAAWALSPVFAAVALLLVPALAWARLRMGRHALREVLGGAALGVATGVALLLAG